jgi:pyruvate dehydrogenase (quinone)
MFDPGTTGQRAAGIDGTEETVARIASEALIERLADWGVDTVFGRAGDGINGIVEGLRRHQDRVRFVLVHHEEAAAFMATAHAKATGKIGVCLATSGPGGIRLLNGLYDAKLDRVPVLAITGTQEAVALDRLYVNVAEYDQVIGDATQVTTVTDMAIRTAYARPGVAHVTIPNQIQVAGANARTGQPVAPPESSPVYLQPPIRPAEADLRRLAHFLNEGEKIAILAGPGALHARAELLILAQTLGAPIVKTLPGKATVPDDSPYAAGGIGLLGTRPSEDLMEEADTLFLVGTSFPYTRYLPSRARTAQINAEPARAGAHVPPELPLTGDARETLRAVIPLLKQRPQAPFLARYQGKMETWRSHTAALEDPSRDPIAPQYLMGVISELATDDAVLTCDSGTAATWAARHWTIHGNRGFYLSGSLATAAPGLPYAIGIQQAFPGRQVIAFVGDGGFAMLMAEFLTAVQHQLPVKVVVNNNNSLGQVLREQMEPGHGVRPPGPPANFAAFASTNGAFGAKVDRPGDLREAMSLALASPGPALVDVNVNPDEPPLPGTVEYEQAKQFATAFLRGQPRRAAITTPLFGDKIEQLHS